MNRAVKCTANVVCCSSEGLQRVRLELQTKASFLLGTEVGEMSRETAK